MPDPWKLFYSYSHVDADLRNELAKFLAPLRFQNRIEEWYDRKIEPGFRWDHEISDKLQSADAILLLLSADFLASDYCFGVEMDVAMRRMNKGDARVVPILLKPCLWKESALSELQLLPPGAKPVTSWQSREDAFVNVAEEINAITKNSPAGSRPQKPPESEQSAVVDLSLVRNQVIAYARLYERVRQKMAPSQIRTTKMEEIFQRMKALGNASFPLVSELAASHSPGEKLAAVSILESFGSPTYLEFLVGLIGSEKPFVGYHAAVALEFAVSAMEPRYYSVLWAAIDDALRALEAAIPGFDTDRRKVLIRAQAKLKEAMETVTVPAQPPLA